LKSFSRPIATTRQYGGMHGATCHLAQLLGSDITCRQAGQDRLSRDDRLRYGEKRAAVSPQPRERRRVEASPSQQNAVHNLIILAIDDDPDFSCRKVGGAGYQVIGVNHPREALATRRRRRNCHARHHDAGKTAGRCLTQSRSPTGHPRDPVDDCEQKPLGYQLGAADYLLKVRQ
jgi:hypothetical protein